MVTSLIPKTLQVLMPGYYAVFYMDAAVESGIKQLVQTAEVMKSAGNMPVYEAILEAVASLHAMRAGIGEVKTENNQELAELHKQAAHQHEVDSQSVGFAPVIEDDQSS